MHSPGKENGSPARAEPWDQVAPLQRGSGWEAIVAADSPHPGLSTRAWISLSVLIGVFFVLSVIVIDRFVRSSHPDRSTPTADLEPSPPDFRETVVRQPGVAVPGGVGGDPRLRGTLPPQGPHKNHEPSTPRPVPVATEPEDVDSPSARQSYSAETLKEILARMGPGAGA